jgi:hypothetical protein
MKSKRFFQTVLLSLAIAAPAGAAESKSLDFKEVCDLLWTNLVGATDEQLNEAAAQGLINELQPKVWLVTNETQTAESTNAVARTAVYDRGFGYIRIGQFREGTDQQVRAAVQGLSASNTLKGLVIDLRFAQGQDYKAAAGIADLFFSTEQPLIDYGDGMKQSTAKENALTLPVALLVNKKTSGAAEALVGILRQADIGVAIGSPTAGQAVLSKEFTLKTGQHIRVATASIKVGKDKALPLTGIKPDITVEVNPQDELAYLDDPYKEVKPARVARVSGGSTNQASVATNRAPARRLNEAELVRMLRDGENPENDTNTVASGEVAKPVIQDTVLSRALDLLKGLAVLNQARRL